MDVTRISDGRVVVLKKLNKHDHPYEAEIGQLFSREPIASESRNRCVPVYDVLQSPLDESIIFLVMPYLMRYHQLRFGTVGEAVECFRQLFEVCFLRRWCLKSITHLHQLPRRVSSSYIRNMLRIGGYPSVFLTKLPKCATVISWTST